MTNIDTVRCEQIHFLTSLGMRKKYINFFFTNYRFKRVKLICLQEYEML